MIRSRGDRIFDFFNYMFLALFCLSILYPFIYIISLSLSTPADIVPGKVMLFPQKLSFESYRVILTDNQLFISYFNTIFRTVLGTFLTVLVMFCAAYPLSKKNLPHRNYYTSFFVFTMFFGGGLIPNYLLIKNLGLLDNRMVFILPTLVVVFSMLIMRNFLMNIPVELEESARIDGANDFRILFSIIFPISIPVIATVGLWTAVFHWNSWFDSLIYIKDNSKHVVQIYLRRLVVESSDAELRRVIAETNRDLGITITPETVKAAALMITTIPILCVYPFIQKYFVKGIMVGSLKG